MMGLSDNAKIGTLLVSLGFLFLFLGVLLFFDAGLMAIGACRLLATMRTRARWQAPRTRGAPCRCTDRG